MSSRQSSRRRFIKTSAALAGLGAGMSLPVRAQLTPPPGFPPRRPDEYYDYGIRSPYVTSKRIGTNGQRGIDPRDGRPRDYGFRTPHHELFGTITPSSLHFIINHAYDPPNINPAEHRLMIHGLVERPVMLSLDDLYRLPAVSRIHFIECSGNSNVSGRGFYPGWLRTQPEATVQDTHGLASCSEWTGVLVSTLLEHVGVKKEATWLISEGAETGNHSKSMPMEKAMDDAMVAYAQNGEPIRPEQGFPLRLVTPGWEGVNNVKWLRRIKVVDQPQMSKRETSNYTASRPDGTARWFQFEHGAKSVITRPSGQQRLAGPGYHNITGIAYSGRGTITRVEVSTNGGGTWQEAEIQGTAHSKAFTRFRLPWMWTGEEAVLMSRSTDDKGDRQPSVAELNEILGLNLSHEWLEAGNPGSSHFNAIQPWRVKRNGEVENALFTV
jgi:sulfane dehydrogenase subunit SoxC